MSDDDLESISTFPFEALVHTGPQAFPETAGANPKRIERDAESFGQSPPSFDLHPFLSIIVLQHQPAASWRKLPNTLPETAETIRFAGVG